MNRRRIAAADERGSAILEFHLLGLVLLIPLVYVLLAALDVQRTAYGATQAAREAGRIFVTTGDENRARLAAAVALRDQGVDAISADVTLTCSATPCLSPGAEVSVAVHATVELPFLPDALVDVAHAEIPVSALHTAVVDRFGELP